MYTYDWNKALLSQIYRYNSKQIVVVKGPMESQQKVLLLNLDIRHITGLYYSILLGYNDLH